MGKRGPAPKGEYVGQTAVLSTRITPELRTRLEEAVTESGKTISREIEHRLRRTFTDDDKISEAFGNRRNYALMRAISMVLEFWHNPSDLSVDWTSDPIAYDQVCRKIDGVLKAMRPLGDNSTLTGDALALADLSARSHPAGVLDEVQRADSAIPLHGRRRQRVLSGIKSDLGPMIERSQMRSNDLKQSRMDHEQPQSVSATRKSKPGEPSK